MQDPTTFRLSQCGCCGLAQRVPQLAPNQRASCPRCHSRMRAPGQRTAGSQATLAFALGALALYPVAVTLPILRIQQLGQTQDSSIVQGTLTLFAGGQWLVGGVVLFCSVILPLAKLAGLVTLSSRATILRSHHRASTYHFVEWTGRWGMLDVLLVAVLVATLKLGSLVDVSAGPAAAAFTLCVLLSLAASATFDPHVLWNDEATEGVSHG